MNHHTFGHRGGAAAGGGGGRNRRHGLTALIGALATVVTLAAAGCATPALTASIAPRDGGSSSGSGPVGTGGVVTPRAGPLPSSAKASPAIAGEPMGASVRSGISGGALFGGNLQLAAVTGQLGRKLAIVRVYYRIGEPFRNPELKNLMASGTTPLVSLSTSFDPGTGPSYASIIAGQEDAPIKSFLAQVEQDAVTYHLGAVYFDFEVEANTPQHQPLGTPAQFVQAWDHVHALAEQMHLDWNQGGRIHWVLILTQIAYSPMQGRAQWAKAAGQAGSYWPGPNEVDIVAADGYNSGGCRGSDVQNYVASGSVVATPQELFNPLVDFARSHGNLPVFVPEWGSVPYASSNEQATFISQMGAFVAANHEIAAALYWDSKAPGKSCDYILNNIPGSLQELAAVAHSPEFQGHVAPPPS